MGEIWGRNRARNLIPPRELSFQARVLFRNIWSKPLAVPIIFSLWSCEGSSINLGWVVGEEFSSVSRAITVSISEIHGGRWESESKWAALGISRFSMWLERGYSINYWVPATCNLQPATCHLVAWAFNKQSLSPGSDPFEAPLLHFTSVGFNQSKCTSIPA